MVSHFQSWFVGCARGVAAVVGLGCLCIASNAPDKDAKAKTEPAPTSATLADVVDLAGLAANPFDGKAKVTVLVFLNPVCPISNRYAPEIQRLAKAFEPKDAVFWLVYPDRDLSVETIQRHLREYGYSLRALHDPRHLLVKRAQAQVTPEAAVFTAYGRLIYHGRIDDRYVDFGKERFAPTERDLESAVKACLANKAVARAATKAIGCYIPE